MGSGGCQLRLALVRLCLHSRSAIFRSCGLLFGHRRGSAAVCPLPGRRRHIRISLRTGPERDAGDQRLQWLRPSSNHGCLCVVSLLLLDVFENIASFFRRCSSAVRLAASKWVQIVSITSGVSVSMCCTDRNFQCTAMRFKHSRFTSHSANNLASSRRNRSMTVR